MIRYHYNRQLDPPAPFVHVALQSPGGEETRTELLAQVDTGADMTVVPLTFLERLRVVQLDTIQVIGFSGTLSMVPIFLVQLEVRGHRPVVVEVLGRGEESFVLLGRDVLNRHRVILDGPQSFPGN